MVVNRMDDNFDSIAKETIRSYNILKNVFFILVIIGGFILAGNISTTYSYYTTVYFPVETTTTDNFTLFSVFINIIGSYSLLFVFIRVTILSYDEKIRANLYDQQIYSKLFEISLKE